MSKDNACVIVKLRNVYLIKDVVNVEDVYDTFDKINLHSFAEKFQKSKKMITLNGAINFAQEYCENNVVEQGIIVIESLSHLRYSDIF